MRPFVRPYQLSRVPGVLVVQACIILDRLRLKDQRPIASAVANIEDGLNGNPVLTAISVVLGRPVDACTGYPYLEAIHTRRYRPTADRPPLPVCAVTGGLTRKTYKCTVPIEFAIGNPSYLSLDIYRLGRPTYVNPNPSGPVTASSAFACGEDLYATTDTPFVRLAAIEIDIAITFRPGMRRRPIPASLHTSGLAPKASPPRPITF